MDDLGVACLIATVSVVAIIVFSIVDISRAEAAKACFEAAKVNQNIDCKGED